MMAPDIFEFDAAWAEKWRKTGVPFLSAPTVYLHLLKDQKKLKLPAHSPKHPVISGLAKSPSLILPVKKYV